MFFCITFIIKEHASKEFGLIRVKVIINQRLPFRFFSNPSYKKESYLDMLYDAVYYTIMLIRSLYHIEELTISKLTFTSLAAHTKGHFFVSEEKSFAV